jgi:3,4-dihydroxy 2-butanone 4-phosphate synthase/GTP cyclohydrolase II
MKFNSIEEIVEDLAQGKMVIVVDDEDRENEGDFLMAASKVKPDDINFMVTHGRGLVCLTLRSERCQQLKLPLMNEATDAEHGTNFTISIEAAEGVTTGISAYDRALTIRAAVAPDATADDIVLPGHIFPIKAQMGGVLTRAGHTEAGCDLAEMAGLEPSAVIVEILNEDGTMARRDDLVKIAEKHDLKMGTIEELIRYRIQNEKSIQKVHENTVATEFGDFKVIAFKDQMHKDNVHLALVKGEIKADTPVLVRVHIEDSLCDVLPLAEKNCGWPLRNAMQHIAYEGEGVIVILREMTNNVNILERLEQLHKQAETTSQDASPQDLKTFGIGAQILTELGVRKMRVMSAPKKFHGLAGFGLEIVEYLQD